ncbi:hypothetical protein SAZ11_07050 [Streptomyces sp. FXJ1.4098]|nr:hypothetical protein [Streptomyces sp. FXJ1.4098]
MFGAEGERRWEGNFSLTNILDRLFDTNTPVDNGEASTENWKAGLCNDESSASTEADPGVAPAHPPESVGRTANVPIPHLNEEWDLLRRLRDTKIIGLGIRYQAEARGHDFKMLLDVIKDCESNDSSGLS